jgi:hypothetical protein
LAAAAPPTASGPARATTAAKIGIRRFISPIFLNIALSVELSFAHGV